MSCHSSPTMLHLSIVKKIQRPRESHHKGRKFKVGGHFGVSHVGARRIKMRSPDAIGGVLRVDGSGVHVIKAPTPPACAPAPPPPPPESPPPPPPPEATPTIPDFVQRFLDEASVNGRLVQAGGIFGSQGSSSNAGGSADGLSTQELLDRLQELSTPCPEAPEDTEHQDH